MRTHTNKQTNNTHTHTAKPKDCKKLKQRQQLCDEAQDDNTSTTLQMVNVPALELLVAKPRGLLHDVPLSQEVDACKLIGLVRRGEIVCDYSRGLSLTFLVIAHALPTLEAKYNPSRRVQHYT